MLKKFDLVSIEDISEQKFDGDVFDLEVEEDSSYNINGIIVHNSGAACTTRRVTGFGVPQLYAIKDCAQRVNGLASIIADGGIREPGDIVKAIWAGADAVMLGYVLSGHDQCPIVMDDKLGKGRIYRGMSSRSVSRRADVAAEGVCVTVPHRGDVKETINEYAASIRAGLSMGNAMTLAELRENVEAIRVSTMSQTESDPVKSLPAE